MIKFLTNLIEQIRRSTFFLKRGPVVVPVKYDE